jgi:hypothetical protein
MKGLKMVMWMTAILKERCLSKKLTRSQRTQERRVLGRQSMEAQS